MVGYTHDFAGMFHVEQLAGPEPELCTKNSAIDDFRVDGLPNDDFQVSVFQVSISASG